MAAVFTGSVFQSDFPMGADRTREMQSQILDLEKVWDTFPGGRHRILDFSG